MLLNSRLASPPATLRVAMRAGQTLLKPTVCLLLMTRCIGRTHAVNRRAMVPRWGSLRKHQLRFREQSPTSPVERACCEISCPFVLLLVHEEQLISQQPLASRPELVASMKSRPLGESRNLVGPTLFPRRARDSCSRQPGSATVQRVS
jgi:hypothetical protein